MVAWDWCSADSPTGCVGGPRPGTVELQRALLALWGPLGAGTAGIYNCRKIGGSGSWSVHAEGRALDLTVPAASPALGQTILAALGEHARLLGLQRVIYWDRLYDDSSPGGEPYHGDSPHHDHLHIEQTRAGAAGLTYGVAYDLLDGQDPEHAGEEDLTMVIVRRLADHEDAARWLLAAGRMIVLNNWANVQALMDKGTAEISLTDTQIRAFPQVG